MSVVKVRAVREGRLWVLHLADGGVTQVRRLNQIDGAVADYVSLMRDVPAGEVRVEVTEVDPGSDLVQAVNTAKAAQQAAVKATETAAALIRDAASTMKSRGLTGVEVATVLGVSPQRVSQLMARKQGGPARGLMVDVSHSRKALTAAARKKLR